MSGNVFFAVTQPTVIHAGKSDALIPGQACDFDAQRMLRPNEPMDFPNNVTSPGCTAGAKITALAYDLVDRFEIARSQSR